VCQPTTLVALVLLLVGAGARAQPSPAPERRERTLTVTGNPAEPPHEIHVAKGVATLLRFKSRINRDAVEVDGRSTRITVDAGDSSIFLEPLIELGSAERLVLRVPFSDGKATAQAVFVLMSDASEVDTRIDVVRHEQTVESCQAELAGAQARCSKISPVQFARAGWLTPKGVISRRIMKCNNITRMDGLVCDAGTTYRAETWVLVDVMIRNESNEHPWVPRGVTIKGMKSGMPVTVRAVEMEPAQIAPGEVGHVFVEMEPSQAGEPFVLELSDTARSLKIPEVNFTQEAKP
jgi:uncharacterized protein (TIGR02268 family)